MWLNQTLATQCKIEPQWILALSAPAEAGSIQEAKYCIVYCIARQPRICISTAEALEKDKEQLHRRINQLDHVQQQMRVEKQQLLDGEQQLKQQLADAQASQGQDQGLKEDMQNFILDAQTTIGSWRQRLWGYQYASTNAAMASFLPKSEAAQDLWPDFESPHLPGPQDMLGQFDAC